MRAIRIVLVAVLVVSVGFAGRAQAAAGDWPMDRHGPRHTGTDPDETALSPATVAGLRRSWQLPQCFVQNNPVVAGRTAVIDDSCSELLYAVAVADGHVRWTAQTAGFGGTPAVDAARGLVFVSSQSNQIATRPAGVEAFRLADGKRLWFAQRAAGANPVTLAGGRLLVPTTNGYVLSLDEQTGRLVWRAHIGSLITQATSVAHGRVLFLAWNGDAYALSESTGAVVWQRHVTHGFREFSTPAVAGGLVSFATSRGQVIALDERTGAERWRLHASTNEIVSAPAVSGTTLIILTEDGRVLARDLATGAARWSRTLAADFLTSPAIANGVVYVADNQVSGSLWALSFATGRTLFRADDIRGFSATLSDPIIANGALYIGEWDGVSDAWLARYALP